MGKVKLRFNRLASQNYKSIKRALQKFLELLKRRIVYQKMLHLFRLFYFLKLLKLSVFLIKKLFLKFDCQFVFVMVYATQCYAFIILKLF